MDFFWLFVLLLNKIYLVNYYFLLAYNTLKGFEQPWRNGYVIRQSELRLLRIRLKSCIIGLATANVSLEVKFCAIS